MTPADWLPADWPAPAGIRAGMTLRTGGTSAGSFATLNLGAHVGDDDGSVVANRSLLRETLRLPAEPCWLEQVHGPEVLHLPGSTRPADAAVTEESGVVLAILTADCLPVVLARRDGGAVGVAHAGWRGLCEGVLEATADALGGRNLLAWLGPAISPPAFEVGDEVREAFLARDGMAAAHFAPNPRGRWQADLYGLARQRLAACGVSDIYGGGRCTFGESQAFYSYRRDGRCGRMATLAWREA